jgi:hypothetical protein
VIGMAYPNWAPKRNATEFCDSIAVGTDIDSVIAHFEATSGRYDSSSSGKETVLHSGDAMGHTFRFFGFMFDKASCDVVLDQSGRVTGKKASMWYD